MADTGAVRTYKIIVPGRGIAYYVRPSARSGASRRRLRISRAYWISPPVLLMRLMIAWVLIVLGLAAGCTRLRADKDTAQETSTPVQAPPNPPLASTAAGFAPKPDGLARGISIYREQFCGLCHRFALAETEGIFGPSHDGFAAVAARRIQDTTYTGRASTPAEYVRESITDPTAHVVPGYEAGRHHMPPYIDLAPEDLEALVHLLLAEE